MKLLYTFLLILTTGYVLAQNVSINILTLNAGIVGNGETIFLQVDIANTDNAVAVPSYKLRPQISIPASIVSVPASGHDLPDGWSITANNGSVIRLSNGTDQVPPNTTRTILIALQAHTVGGPSTISSNLFFSNGVAPGSASGPATAGDVTADNTSTSTVAVTIVTPVTLKEFSSRLINCQPVLNWTTGTEINSLRFDIERSTGRLSSWIIAGSLPVAGANASDNQYSFTDNTIPPAEEKVFYRLKIIDRNGQHQYSQVIPVLINCIETTINVYPNPSKGNPLYISITCQDKKAFARLISADGKTVAEKTLTSGTTPMALSNIADGTYILLVQFENGTTDYKQVIISR